MRRPLSLCVALNADTRLENTLRFGKLFKSSQLWYFGVKSTMPKKDKPMTKKERDEKRKAKKAHKSKTQT